MTRIAAHQSNFLPWPGFFAKAAAADVFVLLDDVQFSKGSFTNRTRVAGNRWRTVPVHCHGAPAIRDVTIAEDLHWTGPWTAFYARQGEPLADLNAWLIRELARDMGIETPFILASDLRTNVEPGPAGLLQICRAFEATEYLSGPSGAKYGVPEAFAGSGVEVVPFEFVPRNETETWSVIESLALDAEVTRRRIREAVGAAA